MAAHYKIYQHGPNRFLLLEGPWDSGLIKVLQEQQISYLRLSAYAGWHETQIDFLRDLPFLEKLDIAPSSLRDISPLYDLPNLSKLALNGVTQKIEFTQIPNLSELNLGWNEKNFSSLLECRQLQSLGLDGYPGADLRRFAKLKMLHNFALAYSKIESLAGIEELPVLGRFSLASVNNLETLDHLEHDKELWYLAVEGAKKLGHIDALSQLSKLRELHLMQCPEVESVRPLKALPALEMVSLLQKTSIKDGDLSVLLTLPSLKHASFSDRKHYTHSNAAFPKNYRSTNKLVLLYDGTRQMTGS